MTDLSGSRPPLDHVLLSRAFAVAAELHRGDLRKGTDIPYLAHPMAVSVLVLEHGGTEVQAAAALLHDVVEDHGGLTRLAALRSAMGPAVARIVEDCSDAFVEEGATKPPWRDRKERYLAHLRCVPPESLLVSCADKLHNARAIVADARALGPSFWERFNASPPDLAWYYRSLGNAFTERLVDGPAASLAHALAVTVTDLEAEAAKAAASAS